VGSALDALLGSGRFQWLAVSILGLANAADAVEVLCIGFILPQVDVQFSITGPEKGALSAAVFAGMLVGGLAGGSLLAGAVADALGFPAMIAALALAVLAVAWLPPVLLREERVRGVLRRYYGAA
jgi:VNT family MFS transporter (synaptic vesicle glycoprotein 2)